MKKTIIGLLVLFLLFGQIGCKNIAPVVIPPPEAQSPAGDTPTQGTRTAPVVVPTPQSPPAITIPSPTPPPPGPIVSASPPPVVPPVTPLTKSKPRLSLQFVASDDDITSYFEGTWKLWKEGLGMIEEAGGRWDTTNERYVTGMRFRNVTIPKGAIITSAVIEFVSDQTNTAGTVKTRFTGQADDNPGAFTTLADLQTRRGIIMGGSNNSHLTSAQVTWDGISSWYVNNSYLSPNLSTIAQEIINRPGWASGNAMVIFWDDAEGRSIGDKAVRSAYSYDGHYSQAPRLNLTYYLPGEEPPILAPEVAADLALKKAEEVVPLKAILRSNIKVSFDSASNPAIWHIYFEGANVTRSELTYLGWTEGSNVIFGFQDPPGTYKNILINVDANTGAILLKNATSLPSLGGPLPQT